MKILFTPQRMVILLFILMLPFSLFCQIPPDFQAWKFATGGIESSPLLVDSCVYIGDMNGKFSKLNANTGEEIWNYKASTYIASHAAYKDGIVAFEAGDCLYGLNAQTGVSLWSFKSTEKTSTTGYDTGWHHSSPVIEGNTAYYGDEWGYINGVNITTGVLDFQYHIPYEYTTATDYNIRSTPIIQDSIIYFGDYDGTVYAISLKDKSAKWITKMETPRWDGSIVSEMVIDNGVLYCGRYTNALIPLDLETGAPLWKFSDWETFLPSTPVFYKDQVIIGTTISSNHIYSLKKATGEKNWELKVKGIFFVKPIIIQDSILVMNSTDPFSDKWGILYFINLEKGQIINEIHLENATESSPVSYKEMVLIGKNDGLYAFKYKPCLGNHGPSKLSFNDSPDNVSINSNEQLSLSYPLINEGNFCDTISVTFETTGDGSKSNLSYTERKGFHFRPAQKIEITVKAKADKLLPGEYTVKISIRSSRQTSDPLFEKKINLTVKGANTTGNLNTSKDNCVPSPNPFSDQVQFKMEFDTGSETKLNICTAEGKMIFSYLYKFNFKTDLITWNGCNNHGIPVPMGLYIYQIQSDNIFSTGKLLKSR
jgi:outer membrane protein assembly factor BamB